MNKLLLLFSLLALPMLLIAQQETGHCAMEATSAASAPESSSGISSLLHSGALEFFETAPDCERVKFHINHYIMYNDQGVGNFDFNDPHQMDFLNTIIDGIRDVLENPRQWPADCNPVDYSGLEVTYSIHQVNNTLVWDREQCDNIFSGNPCFDDDPLCQNPLVDQEMNNIISQYGGENALNMFWCNSATLWDNLYGNGLYLREPCATEWWDEHISLNLGRFPTVETPDQNSMALCFDLYYRYLNDRNRIDCNQYTNDSEEGLSWVKGPMGKALAHEFGHNFSLVHDNFCGQNLMATSYTSGRHLLWKEQLARTNRAFAIKNAGKVVDHSIHLNCSYDLNINDVLHVNYDAKINRDIVIHAGSELIIDPGISVCMADDAKIFVKRGGRLIVNGGTITSCGKGYWEGILVEGAIEGPSGLPVSGQLEDPFGPTDETYAGTVIVHNGGSIKKAVIGISTDNYDYGWPAKEEYYGGLIFCDDATFESCTRGVAFMRYGTPDNLDKSSFNNTFFHNLEDGVTNWASDGVSFTKCLFKRITKSATGGYNCAINVYDGNVFEDVNIGVDLIGTKKNPMSSVIGNLNFPPNEFLQVNIGVKALSVNNFNQTQITNNIFDRVSEGVRVEGPSNIDCYKNDFNSGEGVVMIDSDNFENEIHHNSFFRNDIAITANYNNAHLTFSDNCISQSKAKDIQISGNTANPGIVNPVQGNSFTSAGNCFSQGLTPDISTPGVTNSFTYFVKKGQSIGSCYWPSTAGNYNLGFAFNIDPQDCGAGINGEEPPGEGRDLSAGGDRETLKSTISSLDQKIKNLQASGNSVAANTAQIDLINTLNALALGSQSSLHWKEMESYFAQRAEFAYRIVPFEIYLNANDRDKARNYLNSLPTRNVMESNYKIAQQIYLDFLSSEHFELSSTAKTHLVRTGAQAGPLNAYSRSIYQIITGEKMVLALADQFSERAVTEEEQPDYTAAFSITPNPVDNNYFKINGFEQFLEEGNLILEIFNAAGQLQLSKKIYSNEVYLNQEIGNGLKFISLSSNGEAVYQEKILFIR